MEGKDEMEGRRRPDSALSHALDEARARFSRMPETGSDRDSASLSPESRPARRAGSLLDFAPPYRNVALAQNERARLAMEAIAARRSLTGAGLRRSEEMDIMLENVRAALDECRTAVRECRDVMRNLVSKRDRNYF